MECVLGNKIGSGAGSDVYEYGPDKVCKLYVEKYGADLARWEYKKTADAFERGLPAPRVYEIIEHNGRFGLIMERVQGQTFNQVLFEHIERVMGMDLSQQEALDSITKVFIKQIKDTARVLYHLHQKSCALIQTAKDALTDSCDKNAYLSGHEKSVIHRLIEELPDTVRVCHGDPNPNNLLYCDDGIRIIDWVSCVNGDPLYDVTEYKLMTEYEDDPVGLPDFLIKHYTENRADYIDVFMREYVRLSGIDLSGMQAWIIPLLVQKMRGNNTMSKQKRILDGIRDALHKL